MGPFLRLLLSLVFINCSVTYGQSQFETISHFVDSAFEVGLENSLIKGGVVSVVSTDSLLLSKGYGSSDSINQTQISSNRSLLQIGSIGKVFTTIAVLQLVDEGRLDLDKDINSYLADVNIDDSYDEIITLRQLLSHTAGFDERLIGYAARSKDKIEPLKDHLIRRMPKRYVKPGIEISYSNYGYALAGYIVEKISGISFTDYVHQKILQPMQMNSSGYNVQSFDRSQNNPNQLIKGYKNTKLGFSELPNFYGHPIPAGGIYSSANDMADFMQMLLNQGNFRNNRILSEEKSRKLFTRQFSNHSLLSGYSLGLEEQLIKGHIAFSKGGAVPGFRAIMIIYPDLGLGIFACVNVNDDSFLEDFVDGFHNKYVKKVDVNGQNPTTRIDVDRFTGSYRENRYSRHDIEDIVSLVYTNLWKDDSGDIASYEDGAVQLYKPIEPLIFQNQYDKTRLMVFHEDADGTITGMSRGNKFAGTILPAKYEKLKWYETHNYVNEAIGFIIIGIMGYLLFPLFLLLVNIARLKKSSFYRGKFLSLGANIAALTFALLTVVYISMYFFPVIKAMKTAELYYGMDSSLIKFHYIPFILLGLLMYIIYANYKIWSFKSGMLISRVYYSIFTLCSIAWVLFLQEWHFIGFNF